MGTLKHTGKDAGMLLAIFLEICIRLDRDEIFFWSRSEDELLKLLVQPVADLNKLSVRSVPPSKRQWRLDASPYHSQLELYGHFIKACKSMSREQAKFWLRQNARGLLISLLRKGDIEFLPAVERRTLIPELPGEFTARTFRSKNFRQYQYCLHEMCEELPQRYGGTEATEASCFDIACPLKGDEMFSYAGGAESVVAVAFTPEQIRYLASEQRRQKDAGPLVYEGSNYFPVIRKDKALGMVSLVWRPPAFPGDNQIGRWSYWFLGTKHLTKPKSRLLIRG